MANPPRSIIQYTCRGQTVYYLPPPCCDIFSDLYDADGNLLSHPDGGITGQGDGKLTDFREERAGEKTFWADDRKLAEGMALVPAPIEELDLLVLESFPLQYQLQIKSSLPNACFRYGGYFMMQAGATISIAMVNGGPTAPRVVRCTQVFGTVETVVSLGSDSTPSPPTRWTSTAPSCPSRETRWYLPRNSTASKRAGPQLRSPAGERIFLRASRGVC